MGEDAGGPLVWARRDVALRTCPKPYITAESQTLVEEFLVRAAGLRSSEWRMEFCPES